MAYTRVIPRDLFNEANLLKCHGKLYCRLEDLGFAHMLRQVDTGPFTVWQDASDGSIHLQNVVMVSNHNGILSLFCPLNSREAWPLLARTTGGPDVVVFDDQGNLTPEFKELL